MKYTQEQLEAMSDFEVNKITSTIKGIDLSGITEEMKSNYNLSDYCNNWSDCGQLIDELDLTGDLFITSGGASYSGKHCKSCAAFTNRKKRAVTIVYILTNQGE